jgi:hypothetical protein
VSALLERSVLLDLGEGAFAIRSENELPLRVAGELTENTLVQASDVDPADLWVLPGSQVGRCAVTTRVHEVGQHPSDDQWEDIVEFSMLTTGTVVVTDLVDNDPTAEWLKRPGWWRVRVSARGRAAPRGATENSSTDDPVEWYLLDAWPASPADQTTAPDIVRLTSAQTDRADQPLVVPESKDGLAAAQRIGRDVDQGPGARTLTGELGSATAERTIRGTRRRLFKACAHLTTWSHEWVPLPSWSFSSTPGQDFGLDREHWASAGKHKDQLTGRRGAIRWSFVEVDKPHRAVRAWNWQRPQGRAPSPFFPGISVLDKDSTVTLTLMESKRANQPWTTITFTHDGLPVEWLADMATYWDYQLAIAQRGGFGTAS